MNAGQRDVYRLCMKSHEAMMQERDDYGCAYREGYLLGTGEPPQTRLIYGAWKAGYDFRRTEQQITATRYTDRETASMDAISDYHAHNLERRLANAMALGVLSQGAREAILALSHAKDAGAAARTMLIDAAITGLQRALDTAEAA